jgi:ABC-type nickel/cobalt efflux system permease component RcnA
MQRRLRLAVLILISQMLLIALAISWLVHMLTIAKQGSAYFVENNHFILYSEITASLLITIFAICMVVIQIRRLGERRTIDRRQEDRGRQAPAPEQKSPYRE